MARLSIYVPDALLGKIRSVEASGNMSNVVQRALERLIVEESGAPLYATGKPTGAQEHLARVHDKLVQEAREEYERGYSAGLSGAEILPWWTIEDFASRDRFDITRWSVGWRNAWADITVGRHALPKGARTPDWIEKLAKSSLGGLLDPVCDWSPKGSYLRGFNDAWRDVWNSVEHGEVSASRQEDSGQVEGGEEM